jgi:hypothetical protein
MYRVAGVVLMIGISWMSAAAQRVETAPAYAPLEVSFAYSYARANAGPGQCGCFNMNGGSSEVAFHAFRALSVVADLTGERASSIGPAVGLSLSPSPSVRASATVSQAENSPPLRRGLSVPLTASTGCSRAGTVRRPAPPPRWRYWREEDST